jgi:predicted Rossmann fold nucleotide-binding protein DprA/Smf involved in DNA uptake
MAERLACDLAVQVLVILSGMARGVDTASHRRAIAAKGKTVAVFGTGVDIISLKENRVCRSRFWRLRELSFPNSAWEHALRRRTFPSVIGY